MNQLPDVLLVSLQQMLHVHLYFSKWREKRLFIYLTLCTFKYTVKGKVNTQIQTDIQYTVHL